MPRAADRNRPRRRDRRVARCRSNQGPLALNLALTPTGTLTKREQRKERFTAQYVGTYTVGAGRTSTEAIQTFITGVGTANTMLHSDIQLLIITPKDPTTPIGGVSTIFDRNLNSNTALGFDLTAPSQYVDQARPAQLFPDVSIDPNISSGTYVEAYSAGTMNIHYIPSGKHTPGVISQGTAIVTIHAQIYTAEHQLHPPQLQYRSVRSSPIARERLCRRLIRRARIGG